MSGSAAYGAILGLSALLCAQALPQPGEVAFFGGMAAYLVWAAAVCWRRMRLPLVTMALTDGAAASAIYAISAATTGNPPWFLSDPWRLAFFVLLCSSPVYLLMESRLHPDRWQAWRRYQEGKTVWDIMLGRHVPSLAPQGRTERPSTDEGRS